MTSNHNTNNSATISLTNTQIHKSKENSSSHKKSTTNSASHLIASDVGDKNDDESSSSKPSEKTAVFDINGWSLRFSIVGIIAGAVAIGTPQWFYTIANSRSYGLRSTCVGNECNVGSGSLDFAQLQSDLNCDNSCSNIEEAFGDIRIRWRVIEGFGWLSVVLLLMIVYGVIFSFSYPVRPMGIGAIHVLASICAIFSIAISWGVLYASVSCGSNCYEFGASSIMSGVSCALTFLMSFTGCFGAKSGSLARRHLLARVTAVGCIIAVILQLFALLSPKWIFILPSAGQELPTTNYGIIYQCLRFDCELLNVKSFLSASVTYFNSLTFTTSSSIKDCKNSVNSNDETVNNEKIKIWIGLAFISVATLLCFVLAFISRSGGILEHKQIQEHEQDYDERGHTKLSREEDEERMKRNLEKIEQHQKLQEEGAKNNNSSYSYINTSSSGVAAINLQHQQNNIATNEPFTNHHHPSNGVKEEENEQKITMEDAVEHPTARFLLIIIIFMFITAGNAMILYTFNYSVFCGKNFCEFVGLASDQKTSCDLGVSSMASLIFNALFGLLLMMEIFQRAYVCCSSVYEEVEKENETAIRNIFGRKGAFTKKKGDAEELKKFLSKKKHDENGEKYKQQDHDQDEDEVTKKKKIDFMNKISLYSKTKRNFLIQFTQQRNTIAICNCFFWILFLLAGISGGLMLVAAFTPQWSEKLVSGTTLTYFGLWQYCQEKGRLCYSYSSDDCEGAGIGSEKSRHFLVGGVALFGAGFSILNAAFLTFSFSSSFRLARLGCSVVATLLQVATVFMWLFETYACSSSSSSATTGGDFSIGFFLAISAAGCSGLNSILCLVDTIVFYFCDGSSTEENNDKESSSSSVLELMTKQIEEESQEMKQKEREEARKKREEAEMEKMKKYVSEIPVVAATTATKPTVPAAAKSKTIMNVSSSAAPPLPPPSSAATVGNSTSVVPVVSVSSPSIVAPAAPPLPPPTQNQNNKQQGAPTSSSSPLSALEAATSAVQQHEDEDYDDDYYNEDDDYQHNQQQQATEQKFTKDSDPAEIGLEGNDWEFNEEAGYWWSEELGLFYDHASRAYGNPESGEWLIWNADKGQYEQLDD